MARHRVELRQSGLRAGSLDRNRFDKF